MQPGREAGGLRAPVAADAGGRHDKRWAFAGPCEQQREQLHGLAEAHVVGQASAQPARGEPREPFVALGLVGAKPRREPLRDRMLLGERGGDTGGGVGKGGRQGRQRWRVRLGVVALRRDFLRERRFEHGQGGGAHA